MIRHGKDGGVQVFFGNRTISYVDVVGPNGVSCGVEMKQSDHEAPHAGVYEVPFVKKEWDALGAPVELVFYAPKSVDRFISALTEARDRMMEVRREGS